MNIFDDIKSPVLLWLKAGLFGLLTVVAGVMLIAADNRRYEVGLLAICVWAACRFYYFFFYVLDHDVGGDKNASIFAMFAKLFSKQKGGGEPHPNVIDTPVENLFNNLPRHLPEEVTETLAKSQHVRIERIVSTGQAGPDGFWYDQPEHEWVVVLQGEAVLEFENHSQRLSPGDHVLIPPQQKHRVASTSDQEPTVWLAVYYF